MKVRVYDKLTGNYFKSEVYAKINSGWYEKQLVHVPTVNGGYIKFFDYLDKGENEVLPKVLINTIISDSPKEWIFQNSGDVDKQLTGFEKLLVKDTRFFEYIGYSWLFENKSILTELLNGNAIPFKESIFENRAVASEMDGWIYVETQEDADDLLKNAHSFHDSVLKTANYTSSGFSSADISL